MPETTVPVRTVFVDYVCDRCGKGKMRSTGVVKTSMPPLYQGRCSEPGCGHVGDFRETYPAIWYEEIK